MSMQSIQLNPAPPDCVGNAAIEISHRHTIADFRQRVDADTRLEQCAVKYVKRVEPLA